MADLSDEAMEAAEKAFHVKSEINWEEGGVVHTHTVNLRAAITAYLEALPVVSLWDCATALEMARSNRDRDPSQSYHVEDAKVVLQAAGVKWKE